LNRGDLEADRFSILKGGGKKRKGKRTVLISVCSRGRRERERGSKWSSAGAILGIGVLRKEEIGRKEGKIATKPSRDAPCEKTKKTIETKYFDPIPAPFLINYIVTIWRGGKSGKKRKKRRQEER